MYTEEKIGINFCICISIFPFTHCLAQSDGAVEYTNCFYAEK